MLLASPSLRPLRRKALYKYRDGAPSYSSLSTRHSYGIFDRVFLLVRARSSWCKRVHMGPFARMPQFSLALSCGRLRKRLATRANRQPSLSYSLLFSVHTNVHQIEFPPDCCLHISRRRLLCVCSLVSGVCWSSKQRRSSRPGLPTSRPVLYTSKRKNTSSHYCMFVQ